MKNLLLVVIFFGISACQIEQIGESKSVDVPIISGYISATDTLIQISVRKPLLLNIPQDIKEINISNASVSVQYQRKKIILQYNSKSNFYEAPVRFKQEDNVKLSVKLNSGQEASSETKIPRETKNLNYKFLEESSFQFGWKNSETNYYGYYIEKSSLDNQGNRLGFQIEKPYKYIFKANKNDTDISIIAKFYPLNMINNDKVKLVEFAVINMDSNMYYFQKDRKEVFDLSPFQDRTPVFNNIKGGLGIFGSYTITKFKTNLNAK